MQSMEVLSPYEFQRWVFTNALEFGWTGREPLMLGNDEANEAFQNALQYLNRLKGSPQAGRPGNASSHSRSNDLTLSAN